MGSTFIVSASPTTGYLGKCEPCKRPVKQYIESAGDHAPVGCPDCGHAVMGQRIYGTVNRMTCDSRCESASGPICSCACGGINHGGSWVGNGEILADELAAYRARLYQAEAKREQRREAERKRAVSALESWRSEHAELAAWLQDNGPEWPEGFLNEMYRTIAHDRKPLSERQTEVAERIMSERKERDAKRAARQAEEKANAKPVPTGKGITVTGEVVHTKLEDNPYAPYRDACTSKMLVAGDGWKVWATIPSGLGDINDTTPGSLNGLKGQHVTFIADVSVSRDDPSFGIAKRPRKASIVQPP